jgi:glycosyltransferase involved in cell wall biosynthesis
MRILFITNVFPSPWRPGNGVFNFELVSALAVHHQVSVVCPISWVERMRAGWRRPGSPAHDRLRRAGVEVCYPCFYYPPKVLRSHYGFFLWHSVAPDVRELLHRQRPEAVLAYWAHPDGEIAVRAARLAGVPAVVMTGGSDTLVLTRQRRRRKCILRVLHAADGIIAVSQHLKWKLAEFGIAPEKVRVVYRGVSDAFHPGSRSEARRALGIATAETMLLWVGRMVSVKGLDVLLQACALLGQRGRGFQLYLVGTGPLRCSLETQAETLGLRDTVRFVGAVPHERLPDWYRAADLTLLPSRSEGVPNVLLESLACGTPFVASQVGGIPEMDGGPRSRLVPPDNPDLLAEAIDASLRASALGVGLSTPPPQAIRPRTQAEAADAVIRMLQELKQSKDQYALPAANGLSSLA